MYNVNILLYKDKEGENIARSAHLKIQTHRKNPVGIVRTSFRKNGKTKHLELGRITGFGYGKLKLVQAALQGNAVPTSGFKIASGIRGMQSYIGPCKRALPGQDDILAHKQALGKMLACDGHRALGLPRKQQACPLLLRLVQCPLENMRRGGGGAGCGDSLLLAD
ncbi:MAG: hypothetical protein FWG10_08850 [Eubacteriaceae bacterium]|nr:hypothetical protein [Eubacteriaceae bacterium]